MLNLVVIYIMKIYSDMKRCIMTTGDASRCYKPFPPLPLPCPLLFLFFAALIGHLYDCFALALLLGSNQIEMILFLEYSVCSHALISNRTKKR